MKAFQFRLQRVLHWRSLQERLALADLEKLHAEMATLEAQAHDLEELREQSGREIITQASASGVELAFLDAFRQSSAADLGRLHALQADCRRRIAAQMDIILDRRRAVRMLERLKQRRLDRWQTDSDRELEAQVAESHLQRWPQK